MASSLLSRRSAPPSLSPLRCAISENRKLFLHAPLDKQMSTPSRTFQQILELVRTGQMRISAHGYDELAADDILIDDILEGLEQGIVVEDYPTYRKGPCVLVLQFDADGYPIHVLWGIPLNKSTPAVVVTAYRPDPDEWTADFKQRKR